MSSARTDRLRDLATRSNDGNLAGPALGAADTIDAQAARIEALQAERDENEGVIKVWRRRCQEAEAERDAAVLAEREATRQRDAMLRIRLKLDTACCGATTSLGHWMDDNDVWGEDLEYAHRTLIMAVTDTRADMADVGLDWGELGRARSNKETK